MKVIQHGVPPTKIVTCRECGCEFSYIRKDIHEKTNYDYNSYQTALQEKELYVECPDCGNHVSATIPTIKYYEDR